MSGGAYVMHLPGLTPYREAWELQRSLAGAVSQGAIPDTCYPILDLNRHGRDVKKYCRDLEEAIIVTLAALDVAAERIDGLTGVWLPSPPRKIASIGVHISRWVTTHGYALNVNLDPAPFRSWITACGLEDSAFTTMAHELGREITIDEVRPLAAHAFGEVFGVTLEELPAEEGSGLWPQPVHEQLAAR
jgi:lipoate-protein ligase B